MKSRDTQASGEVPASPYTPTEWMGRPLGELVDFIVDGHHAYTRAAIEKISRLLGKVIAKHGEQRPELAMIATAFGGLAAEMEPHMAREERVLFPFIRALDGGPDRQVSAPPFGTVRNPVRVMMNEHDRAAELLAVIEKHTANFTPPSDACAGVTLLYATLSELRRDLLQHVQLENLALFPRALELEAQKSRAIAA